MTKVSVTIPVKNEANSIISLLDSLFLQTRKPDEVVIVDAGSKDETANIIKAYIERRYPIKLVLVNHAFPGKARNIAIENASGEIIAMTDAGTIVDKNWLKELIKPLENNPQIDFVWGGYRPMLDSFFQKYQAFVLLSPPRKFGSDFLRYGSFISMAARKKIWESIGKFPENLRACEDMVMRKKIEESNLVTTIVPEAKVFWWLSPNFWAMLKKIFVYSKNRVKANINLGYLWKVFGFYCLIILGFVAGLFRFFLALLVLVSLVRVAKKIRREELEIKKIFWNPLRWFVVMVMMVTADLIAVAGFLNGFILRNTGGREDAG